MPGLNFYNNLGRGLAQKIIIGELFGNPIQFAVYFGNLFFQAFSFFGKIDDAFQKDKNGRVTDYGRCR